MKLIVVIFITFFVLITNNISQIRITTNDGDYTGFILEENQNQILLNTLLKQQLNIEKSKIIKRQVIFVILKYNNFKFNGNILKISEDELELNRMDSSIVKIKINTIENGQSEDYEVEQFLKNLVIENQKRAASAVGDEGKKYSKFGVTFGLPTIVNFNYSSSNKTTCGGVGIGYLGGQVHFGINVSSTENSESNMMLNLNFSSYEIKDGYSFPKKVKNEIHIFVGPLIDFYSNGFHAQVGFGYGINSPKDEKFKPFIQVGYAYRWRK